MQVFVHYVCLIRMLKKIWKKTDNKPIILLNYICNNITFMLQKLFVSMQFLTFEACYECNTCMLTFSDLFLNKINQDTIIRHLIMRNSTKNKGAFLWIHDFVLRTFLVLGHWNIKNKILVHQTCDMCIWFVVP